MNFLKSIPWHSAGRLVLNGGALIYSAASFALQGGVHMSPQATAAAGAIILVGNLLMHGPVAAPAQGDAPANDNQQPATPPSTAISK